MHTFRSGWILLAIIALVACTNPPRGQDLARQQNLPYPAVVAHRGASYDAPEETAAAYILARDLGADYLEADLQRTKDGVLVCVHDGNLQRTSNIATVYPNRIKDGVNSFTLDELKKLDAGSWFNTKYPERARPGFEGQTIVTLDELIDIALGGSNKPGIYLETKAASQFPGIEKDLFELLKRRGLLDQMDAPAGFDTKKNVGVMYTPGRVILQTFEPTSLPLLNQYMPQVPKVFLLWLYTQQEADDWGIERGIDQSDPTADLTKTYGPLAKPIDPVSLEGKSAAEKYAQYQALSAENLRLWLNWAKQNGAVGVGPSTQLAGFQDPVKGDQSYMDLVAPWMMAMYHDLGLVVHPYTIDDLEDIKRLTESKTDPIDGVFTNRSDVMLKHYGRTPSSTVAEILDANKF